MGTTLSGTKRILAAALLATSALAGGAFAADKTPITADGLVEHIKVLASDAFEGRKPGTAGEEKTVAYIAEEFRKLGLKPAGDNGTYFQDVPMVEITNRPDGPMTVTGKDGAKSYEYFTQTMIWSRRRTDRPAVKDSEVVFVGYGITEPQQDWDDYAGIDVRGKTVVMLVNDPGFATGDPKLFDGVAMTYHGRWTYKYENAAKHGAAAVLIVHETRPAGYPWGVVANSHSVPRLDLMPPDGGQGRAMIEGWVQLDVAKEMFAAAGLNFDELKDRASDRGFKAVPMGIKVSMALNNSFRDLKSRNVAAVLPGASKPDEVVMYTAHWDHLGRGNAVKGDDIYNGAVDNATGTAGLLELAEAFAKAPTKPARSVAFVAFTAEEQGLLGSEHYALNPLFPVAKTVGGYNMDGLNYLGPTRDLIMIGAGKSEMDEPVLAWAKANGKTITPEVFPERGIYYRSDHFNLAKVGVPMLYTKAGVDSVAHGAEWGKAKADEFTRTDYHQPSDEWKEGMTMEGGAEEVRMLYELGRDLADSTKWPAWKPGSEFKPIREKSLSAAR
ncbi:MAG TPA: M28 family metallopeptidase [Azospirillaceae bacterium]|nr:M28 family metallopeptidase [Azospirillaceae bacterium]